MTSLEYTEVICCLCMFVQIAKLQDINWRIAEACETGIGRGFMAENSFRFLQIAGGFYPRCTRTTRFSETLDFDGFWVAMGSLFDNPTLWRSWP